MIFDEITAARPTTRKKSFQQFFAPNVHKFRDIKSFSKDLTHLCTELTKFTSPFDDKNVTFRRANQDVLTFPRTVFML